MGCLSLAGPNDPTNCALPQQPLHKCFFPNALETETFRRVTNPHQFLVDGVDFLGTSGQNVDDIVKFSRGCDRLAIAANTLKWSHIAPTAPDTLACYPFPDDDPFILQQAPHVYFIGNQPEFQMATAVGPQQQRIQIVLVPNFAKTGAMVLLNLKTLQCRVMNFGSML